MCSQCIDLVRLFVGSNFHLFRACISSPRLIVSSTTNSSDPDRRSHPLLIRLRLFFMESRRNCFWINSTVSTESANSFSYLTHYMFCNLSHLECCLKECSLNTVDPFNTFQISARNHVLSSVYYNLQTVI